MPMRYNIKITICHTAGHYGEAMTCGKVTSSGRGRTAAAIVQNEQTVEEHSTLEQQPPGWLDHPA